MTEWQSGKVAESGKMEKMEHNSTSGNTFHTTRFAFHVLRFTLLFLAGLAATRLLFEGFFPRLSWLGRPFPALSLAILFALSITWLIQRASSPFHPFTLSPVLLNLLYLFDPTVDLVQSRLIFAASVWMTAVLASGAVAEWRSGKGQVKNVIFLLAALIPIYFLTMPTTVGRADTFEFQVIAPQLGIAHPTGYPLYLLLGKLFTLIPVGSVAWRLNVATAVYALIALTLLYQLGRRLLGHSLPALLGAVALGLTPVFWSQAIEAEVYTLHALIIVASLFLMYLIVDQNTEKIVNCQLSIVNCQFLFFLIGLGLTNHLTTVFLVPPALLTLFFTFRLHHSSFRLHHFFKLGLAFLAPLTLYAYLPLRWTAVNGEAMGFGRFVEWVVGGRFQDALQWSAWLRDPTRYEIVGRLFLDNWGWINLSIAFIGFIYLFVKQWRIALILLVTWLGFTFYNLNYYVPDLAVFLIPAQIVIAIWWMGGVTAVLKISNWQLTINNWQLIIVPLLIIPTLLAAVANWPRIDRSQDDGLTEWGSGVLSLPLAENAAILADSEKIAPLYYLQQAEGVRPDLDIMVLPDEAAYRAELDGRIAAGQTVYLARFLPGLEGIYHLRSMGPLTEVSAQPMTILPATAVPATLTFDSIHLIGYELEPNAAIDGTSTAVTLYWRKNSQQSTINNQHVYVRWEGETTATSQLPANNYYPIPAWDTGEIVPDFHLLPHPISSETQQFNLQVALAPPFTPKSNMEWQTVTAVWGLENPARLPNPTTKPYAQIGDTILREASFPAHIRPQDDLTIQLTGWGNETHYLRLSLRPVNQPETDKRPLEQTYPVKLSPFILTQSLNTDLPAGAYEIFASYPKFTSRCGMAGGICRMPSSYCGWLRPASDGCVLGEVEISGVPLPANATNYEDKIALLAIDLPQTQLQPGGQLPVNLTWQSLAPIAHDYTVFIQILDANDQIVGQTDAWPRQGTHPTSQWELGETINDPYLIQLDGDLPPGQYRLLVGWYLLADLRRLPVLNADGAPVDDKLLVPGLIVP